jgi:hypothetical protein
VGQDGGQGGLEVARGAAQVDRLGGGQQLDGA